MKKQIISKYSKTSLFSFLLFIFSFSFSIFFCNLIYGSEEENYKKQEENCIQETKQREEKLFEMFYDFKYDIAPMLLKKNFEDLKDYYKGLPKDQRKKNFDYFLDFYKDLEEYKLDTLIRSEKELIKNGSKKTLETLEKLKERQKQFKSLKTDFDKKIFFLNPDVRESGLFNLNPDVRELSESKLSNPKEKEEYCKTYEEAEYLINFINFSDKDIEINEEKRKTKITDLLNDFFYYLYIDYPKEKYCKTYNDFFYYLYFDFILKKINYNYKDELHLTQRDPRDLKRTQLFSYLPEVTNLQFKIEYLRYFYKILTELYKNSSKSYYNLVTSYYSIESKSEQVNKLSELIKQCVGEYEEENKSKRQEKLEKFLKDNLELFQYLDQKDTLKNKLERDFNNNLEDSKIFLQEMLNPDIFAPNICKTKPFLSKTSLYNDNLEIPSLNKKELIEHIIHRNDELINKDLLSIVLKNTEEILYRMYLDYSAFVFRSSCLYEKDDKNNNINVLEIINNKKKDLSNYCKEKSKEYNDIYKTQSHELQQYLQHLNKELDYQTKDIDNRYADPEINKYTQKPELNIDRQTQQQNIKKSLDAGSFLDTSSLGMDQKTIYLQNPEVLKYQLQLQLDEIKKEYISKPFEFYKNEINVIVEEAEYLINFINFSNKEIVSDKDIEINEEKRKTKITDKIKSLLNEIKKEYISKPFEFYKNEINVIVEEAESVINFSDKDIEINEEKRKTKITDKIKSLQNNIDRLKIKLETTTHNKIDDLNFSNENIELKDKIQSLQNNIDLLEKKPHYKTHTLKDISKKLFKTYLATITDLIDDKNIIDIKIQAYKEYYKRKRGEILDPCLQIISNLQIEYYNSVSDILKDIEETDVVYTNDKPKVLYSSSTPTKKYSFSKNLIKDKNIDDCYEQLQKYLCYRYPRKKEQNCKLSLDNIQWIGQFLADYKKELKDNFDKCDIDISNTETQVTTTIESNINKFDIFKKKIEKDFKTMQEPKNINTDHNIELTKILTELKGKSKELKNFENLKSDSDYKDQKQKLDNLCKNRDIFKTNMEELINIVKNQHKKEKKRREFEIEIQKNKQNLIELNKIIESYPNQNNKEKKENNGTNEINSLTKEDEIVKKRQETLNSLINSLNDETQKSLIEAKSKIEKKIKDLEKNLEDNKKEHFSLTEEYKEKQKNLNILDKENFLNLKKDYNYINAESFFVEREFDFISWLGENFPNRKIIDNKCIDSQEKKQKPIKIDTINYPYCQDVKNFPNKRDYTFFQNLDSSFYLVLNIHLNSNKNYNWNNWNKIKYKVKFYE